MATFLQIFLLHVEKEKNKFRKKLSFWHHFLGNFCYGDQKFFKEYLPLSNISQDTLATSNIFRTRLPLRTFSGYVCHFEHIQGMFAILNQGTFVTWNFFFPRLFCYVDHFSRLVCLFRIIFMGTFASVEHFSGYVCVSNIFPGTSAASKIFRARLPL